MCKACGGTCGRRRTNRVSGMTTKKTMTVIKGGAQVAAGFAVAGMLTRAQFAQANPILGIVLPIAGAIAAKSFLGKGGDSIALGMVAQGVNQGIKQYAPGVAQTVGLSGTNYYQSTYLPGVAGTGDIIFD